MPDVKWYTGSDSGGGLTISTTTVTGGTNNRLLRQAGGVVGNSLFSDDGTDITQSSGTLALPAGAANAVTLKLGGDAFGLYRPAANQWAWGFNGDNNPVLGLIYGDPVKFANRDSGQFTWSSTGAATGAADTGIKRHAAGSVRFTDGGNTGTASVVLGTSSHPATPASTYLFIEGVSGAGGTPTTSHVTAGSGVAIYVQQAHDAQATKFVIAYNNYNGINYLVGTLDGSTATWTNSTTRP